MVKNTRSYLENKIWYRLLKVIYILFISVVCALIGFFIYDEIDYQDIDTIHENKITNFVGKFGTETRKNPHQSVKEIRKKFPELKNINDDVLGNLQAIFLTNLTQDEIKYQFPEIFYRNTKEYINSVKKSLDDFMIIIDSHPDATQEQIEQTFPEFKGKKQALADFIVTMEAKPNLKQDEIEKKFPEFYNEEFINNYSGMDNIIIYRNKVINSNNIKTLILIGQIIIIIGIAYLITELFKRILYYIILGSFNPKS